MSNDAGLNQATVEILEELVRDGLSGRSSFPRKSFCEEAGVGNCNNQLFNKLVDDCADLFLLLARVGLVNNNMSGLDKVTSGMFEATIGAWAIEELDRDLKRDERDACQDMRDVYAEYMADLREWRSGRIPRRYEGNGGGRGVSRGRDDRGFRNDDRRGGGINSDFFNSSQRRTTRSSTCGTNNAFANGRSFEAFGSDNTDTRERHVKPGSGDRFVSTERTAAPQAQQTQAVPDQAIEEGFVNYTEVSIKEASKYPVPEGSLPYQVAFNPYVNTGMGILTLGADNKKYVQYAVKKIGGEDIMDQARHALAATFGSNSFSTQLPSEDIAIIRQELINNTNRIVDAAEEALGGAPSNPNTPRYLEVSAENVLSIELGMDSAWAYRRAEYDQRKLEMPTLDVYVRSNYMLELIKVSSVDQLELLNSLTQIATQDRFMAVYRELLRPTTALPTLTANALNRRMTAVVNAALRVNLGMPKLRIQDFSEDFEALPGYLYNGSGQSISKALTKHIMSKLPLGCTLFPQEARQQLLDTLGYESDIIPETQAFVTEVKTAIISLRVAEMGFAYDAGVPALVTREQTPLLFNLCTILLKNYRPHNRYLVETADGYRFEVSKSWISENEMLIAAV